MPKVKSLLEFRNDGRKLVATNFWQTNLARTGHLYLSINAGCFRLILPEKHAEAAAEMKGCQHIVISMLPPDQWKDGAFAVEWMAEDGTDEPWSCHLSPGQVDRGPKREDADGDWEARVYVRRGGLPHEALRVPAYLRFVLSLPCLIPIAETIARSHAMRGRPN